MKPKNSNEAATQAIAEENPEWTRGEFARAIRFSALPTGLQRKLLARSERPRLILG